MRLCRKFRHNLIVFLWYLPLFAGLRKKVCVAWLQQTFSFPNVDMPYGVSNGWLFVL